MGGPVHVLPVWLAPFPLEALLFAQLVLQAPLPPLALVRVLTVSLEPTLAAAQDPVLIVMQTRTRFLARPHVDLVLQVHMETLSLKHVLIVRQEPLQLPQVLLRALIVLRIHTPTLHFQSAHHHVVLALLIQSLSLPLLAANQRQILAAPSILHSFSLDQPQKD